MKIGLVNGVPVVALEADDFSVLPVINHLVACVQAMGEGEGIENIVIDLTAAEGVEVSGLAAEAIFQAITQRNRLSICLAGPAGLIARPVVEACLIGGNIIGVNTREAAIILAGG